MKSPCLAEATTLSLALMCDGRWWNLDRPAPDFWQDLQRAIRLLPSSSSPAPLPAGVVGRPAALPAPIHHRNALARLCGASTSELQRQRLAYHADWLLSLLRPAAPQSPPPGPLVTVVIPVFNRSDTIAEAVACCLAQTHTNLEIVVVDDGSTEDIAAALRPFRDRIRLLRQEPNQGAGAARNLGITQARGRLIHFLDADDLLAPDTIARKLQALAAIPDADLVFSGARQSGLGEHERQQRLRYLEPPDGAEDCPTRDLLDVMVKRYPFLTSTVLVARHNLLEVGLFDPELRRQQDTELFFRLALRSIKAIGITGQPTHRRVTERSLSARLPDMRYSARFRTRCVVALAATSQPWQLYGSRVLAELFKADLFEVLAFEREASLPQCRRALLRALRHILAGAAGPDAASRLRADLKRGLQNLSETRPSLANTSFYQALCSL